ncbi:actinia tenebrosa protease inhibitors-like [Cydia fagiglandana]|uniref:actinia tenebrosa protease inhibitors-like n=1 Tax=Cydia fagiglandana TaxID=1458189 RepID=UPI002FEE235E
MHFRRCFVVLGMVVRLLDGNMITVVSQPEGTSDDTPSVEVELTTASKTEATSARPTTFMRRIDIRNSDYNFEHTTDIFQRSGRRFFGDTDHGRFDQMWKWDYWCMLQPETGNCGSNQTKYYYNMQVDQCLPHVFSGCSTRNNKNQFESVEECHNHCKGSALMPASLPVKNIDVCKLQPVSGRCLGNFRMYYYDVNEKLCKTFFYGGCAGNENNFEMESQCFIRCQEESVKPTQVPQNSTEEEESPEGPEDEEQVDEATDRNTRPPS